jgi:hypothetical protein
MRPAVILLASLSLGLAACGDKTINAGNAETTVTDFVSEETGFEPEDMSCPEDVPAEVGEKFECSFTGPEGPYVAFVEVSEVDGDDAIFRIRTRPAGGDG